MYIVHTLSDLWYKIPRDAEALQSIYYPYVLKEIHWVNIRNCTKIKLVNFNLVSGFGTV